MSFLKRILPATARQRTTTLNRVSSLRAHLRNPAIARTMASQPSIPKTMKGILIEETGGTEVLQYRTDLPVPEPKDGELLVKNDFIGINYIDTYFRTGLYSSPKPEILGREAASTVLSSRSPRFSPGDRVVWMATGGYAEYTATPAEKSALIPPSLSSADAAAALLQGLTALTLIREAHAVQPNDWVLVHAAAGGVGLWLCQLLRGVGARTIATASSAEKRTLAKENGAGWAIGYGEGDALEEMVKEVKDITGGEGVIAVFDGVGKRTFDADLECLARKGSLVSFGNASGAVPPVTIARLSPKNIKLLRPTLYQYVATQQEFDHYVAELWDFILEKKLNVRIHEVYPLQDAARAHDDIEGRKTTGKLLLKP
ncbi:MAG: NADPH:quinone reductase [Piccolia ochrophora]|nr:MAG: NADPH:quinone reductase [Piccolia ochrophora]